MKAKALILVLFVGVAAAIVWFARGNLGAVASKAGVGGGAIEISMLYSTEKKDWIEACATAFAKEHPEIKVTLVGKGSLEAAQSLLEGKDKPTVWSPADTLVLNLLDSDWRTKNGAPLFATSGDDAPEPLVITPLVFAIWQDRADVLLKASGGHISWKSIEKAVSSNQGWPAIGGKTEWGFVKLGHTDPTRSNSGMQALTLMTLEFYGKTNGLQIADVLDPKYQAWLASLEKGVPHFENSTGTFMTDMVRFGPSKYDIAVVYENLAISQIENAQGRWGDLKIYYPQTTLWSDHPVAVLQGDWVTEPQKRAARTWIAFLRSRPMQEQALRFGFRPGDASVPVRTSDGQNPFNRLAPYGIQVDIPPVATPPEGAVVRNLLTMWTRVVGSR
jgi:ABC-type Fe3+ transport system substrate-binding protein